VRILFLARSLVLGGAERQFVGLARGLRRRGHEVAVAVCYAGQAFEEELLADGVVIHDLAKGGRWDAIGFLARLARLVRSERPDILHSWGNANIFAAAVKPFLRSTRVVWGIRTAKSDLRAYDLVMRLNPWLERRFASLADAVIVNSEAGRRQAVVNGLDDRKMVVIPNGIDCEIFHPDPVGRGITRRDWGIPDGAFLVGMVARLDPVKNHGSFIQAASRVATAAGNARFVLVQDGERPGYRKELERLASDLGLSGKIVWASRGKATSAVYSAFDLAVLSSNPGESFPNVVAEAMACGTPVVTTDTGDAALIVGELGIVVSPGDPAALARAMLAALDGGRREGRPLPDRLRQRIQDNYSIDVLLGRTERALERVRQGIA